MMACMPDDVFACAHACMYANQFDRSYFWDASTRVSRWVGAYRCVCRRQSRRARGCPVFQKAIYQGVTLWEGYVVSSKQLFLETLET